MYILTEVGSSMYVCSMDGVAFPFPERLYGGKVRCVTAAWVCILVYIYSTLLYTVSRYGAMCCAVLCCVVRC